MDITQKFALMFLGNGLALYLVNFYVDGVSIPLNLEGFVLATLALTIINLFIRPLIKLALGPILFLTLGLGSIFINAITLYMLDFLLTTVTIHGLVALVIAGLFVGGINLVLNLTAKFI